MSAAAIFSRPSRMVIPNTMCLHSLVTPRTNFLFVRWKVNHPPTQKHHPPICAHTFTHLAEQLAKELWVHMFFTK